MREAITTLGLWDQQGTFTLPDGTTYYRDEPHYQPPLPITGARTVDRSHRWVHEWPAFAAALQDKLERGAQEYGDASFERQPARLLEELAAEALDLAGWGFVLWVRLRDLQAPQGQD